MNSMTPLCAIAIDKLTEGMRLGEDIHDRSGALIAAGDMLLDASTLDLLRQQAISRIWVVDDLPASEVGDAELIRLRHLFRHVGDSPAARQLLTALLAYRRQQQGERHE